MIDKKSLSVNVNNVNGGRMTVAIKPNKIGEEQFFIFTALFLHLFLLSQCDPFYFVCSISLFSNELWTFALFKVSQG